MNSVFPWAISAHFPALSRTVAFRNLNKHKTIAIGRSKRSFNVLCALESTENFISKCTESENVYFGVYI